MNQVVKFGLMVAAVSLVLGVPVFATPAPVPEPGMFGMLAAGIGAVAGLRVYFKR